MANGDDETREEFEEDLERVDVGEDLEGGGEGGGGVARGGGRSGAEPYSKEEMEDWIERREEEYAGTNFTYGAVEGDNIRFGDITDDVATAYNKPKAAREIGLNHSRLQATGSQQNVLGMVAEIEMDRRERRNELLEKMANREGLEHDAVAEMTNRPLVSVRQAQEQIGERKEYMQEEMRGQGVEPEGSALAELEHEAGRLEQVIAQRGILFIPFGLSLLVIGYLVPGWFGVAIMFVGAGFAWYGRDAVSREYGRGVYAAASILAMMFLLADLIFLFGALSNGLGVLFTPTGIIPIIWLVALLPFQDPQEVWDSSELVVGYISGGDEIYEGMITFMILSGVVAGAMFLVGATGVSRQVLGVYIDPLEMIGFVLALMGPIALHHLIHDYLSEGFGEMRREGAEAEGGAPEETYSWDEQDIEMMERELERARELWEEAQDIESLRPQESKLEEASSVLERMKKGENISDAGVETTFRTIYAVQDECRDALESRENEGDNEEGDMFG
ncbi:MAG: DMT family transporter [Candidatus Nanohaloarchaea archaeon]|nr:DMT family transporter [Candidatus Nanohaloarchaea archaeon]